MASPTDPQPGSSNGLRSIGGIPGMSLARNAHREYRSDARFASKFDSRSRETSALAHTRHALIAARITLTLLPGSACHAMGQSFLACIGAIAPNYRIKARRIMCVRSPFDRRSGVLRLPAWHTSHARLGDLEDCFTFSLQHYPEPAR